MLNGPTEYNLEIYKGDDFKEVLTFESSPGTPVVMNASWSGKAQIRTRQKRTATLIAEFSVSISDPPNGEVTLELTDTVTGAITRAKGYWDLLLTDETGFKEYYAYGEVTFNPTVTTD